MIQKKLLELIEKKRIRLIYIPLTLYWLLLIFATSLPTASMPSVGINDKFEHFGAYFGLTFLLVLTYRFQGKFEGLRRRPHLYSFITIALYGMVDEIHQIFIPGRSCEFGDFLADVIGGLIGLWLTWLLLKRGNNEGSADERQKRSRHENGLTESEES